MFWEKIGTNKVTCELCPRTCVLEEGDIGKCNSRKVVNGQLKTLNWKNVCSIGNDPIEKKPLFHFWPGSQVLSIALPGCNLSCKFCQNWQISQKRPPTEIELEPEQVVEIAIKNKSQGIAYTYSEPTIFYEYAYEVAKLAKKKGLYNVWISNGMINEKPIHKLSKVIDAANIDLKSFRSEFYKESCGGVGIEPILKAIKTFHKRGTWIEITNLIIPTMNDNENEIKELVNWIAKLDKNIPLHFSKFHPDYKLSFLKPTHVEVLEKFAEIAKKQLNHVYLGNVPMSRWKNTFCAGCGELLIERTGHFGVKSKILEGNCPKCGLLAPIIGNIING